MDVSLSEKLHVPQAVAIVVLGTDALLAAAPATPVQLAHACLRAGFSSVIPASWGDELIAAAVLRRLPQFGSGPAIQCSCPVVAHRLLSVSGDLRAAMLPLVPPPVAVARYVRTISQATRTRITYVGNCPGAVDESIDIRMSPDALVDMLAEREILLSEQPRVFESVIPSDRRRFRSQPGGLPTAETLWSELGARTLVEIDGEDMVGELAQHLLSGKNVLIDVAARMGCVCSGAVASVPPREARAMVASLEPPRATMPLVDEQVPIELDLSVPAAPRAPVDVMATPPHGMGLVKPPVSTPPGGTMPLGHRVSPMRGLSTTSEPRPPRVSSPIGRPVVGSLPTSRDGEGKTLPRAYVARRRSSPKGLTVVSGGLEDVVDTIAPRRSSRPVQRLTPPPVSVVPAKPVVAAQSIAPAPEPRPQPGEVTPPPRAPSPMMLTPSHVAWIVGVVAGIMLLVFAVSAITAVAVGRSVREPAPAATNR